MSSEGDTESCASTTTTMSAVGSPGGGGSSSVRKRKFDQFDHDEEDREPGAAADIEATKLAECIRCGTAGLHPLDFLRDHVLASCTVRCALNCGWVGPACVYKTMHQCQSGSDTPHASENLKIKQLEQLVQSLQSEVLALKEQLSQCSQSSASSTAATVGSSAICNADTSTEMDTSERQETSAALASPPQKVSSITSITPTTSIVTSIVTSMAAAAQSEGLLDLLHAVENAETHGSLDRSFLPNANQVSSELKDTTGAGVTHPHRHAVRFTQEEQKIIERAYLVFEAWQCFGDHPRAGSGGVGGGPSGYSLSHTRHIWATIARAYFPTRVGEPRFTQSLRNYCRKLVGRICGPRDAEATAEYERLCSARSRGVISSLPSSTKCSSNMSNEYGVSHAATPPPPPPPPPPAATVHFPFAFFPTTLPSVPIPSRLTPYLTMMEEIIRSSQMTASSR
jgi:hypothetical protein